MIKFLKRIPPFSWTRGYVKFSALMLTVSIANSICLYITGYMKSPLAATFVWIFFNIFGQFARPWMLKTSRPCKDCNHMPLNKKRP
jgi:hypothetical protein